MNKRRAWAVGLVALTAAMCAPQDDDRCGEDFYWDGQTCLPEEDTEADGGVDAGADTDTTADGGPDTDSDDGLPVGLGEPCTEEGGECDGLQADYCTANPFAPQGYCTVRDCSTVQDECPGDYICCDVQVDEQSPNFCATPEDFTSLSGLGICQSR